MKKILGYFAGVKKELVKVRWTEKKELLKYTMATLSFILFFSLFFYAVDLIMAWVRTI